MLRVKRIYESVDDFDGKRVLVDRLWPRGVSKEQAKLDIWMKDVAPSNELRRWFGHDPDKFDEFLRRYKEELAHEPALGCIALLKEWLQTGVVTLLYGARDESINQAVVLRQYLESGSE